MGKIAIIKTGGKQYKVQAGDKVNVEKLAGEVGDQLEFSEVLLVSDEKGETMQLGTPNVEGVKVVATIVEQGRAKKVTGVKFKAKVRYRRKLGHRQPFTKLEIVKI